MPCLLCGRPSEDEVTQAGDLNFKVTEERFRFVRCAECGLVWINPRPPVAEIGRYYPADYHPHRQIQGTEDDLLKRNSKRFGPVEHLPPGRYLDVGCGSGYDMVRLRDRGWQVSGFEVSRQAAEAGRAAGLDIRHGADLAQAGFPEASFDLSTMFCVLPHLHDPLTALREVRRLLKPGGILFMTMPNLQSVNFNLFGPRWYHLDPPRHLYFFSRGNLEELALRAGFRPEGRRFRSGVGGFKNSLHHAGASSPIARVLRRIIQVRPLRWAVRCVSRFIVDPLHLGDTIDHWWAAA